jgi:NADPH:quinone reductase-like Zn-dependent oxidoreductase
LLAAYASSSSFDDPLSALAVGDVDDPVAPEGWVVVEVRAACLNHHDVWSLRGVGLPPERLPMILGCDAAGVDPDGNPVIVHALIVSPEWHGIETADPRRTLLSELHPGTLAERVAVPRRNLVPKPGALSFEEACCLPTAWLTAYRMLFDRSGLEPGQTVLVQGAGGGVSSAAIALARAGGFRVWTTSRD